MLRWCTRIINVELATRLIDAVGPIDIFHERYFAARPDLMKRSSRDLASRTILVIYALTAASGIGGCSSRDCA